MFPAFAMNDPVDMRRADVKQPSNVPLSKSLGVVEHPHNFNISAVQFGKPICLALARSVAVSSFKHHIAHIVGLSSKKKMGRIHTGRDIAFMAHAKAVWNWAFGDNPRSSMRSDIFPYWHSGIPRTVLACFHQVCFDCKHSVSPFIFARSPQPARPKFRKPIRDRSIFVDTLPKSVWESYRMPLLSQVTECNLFHSLVLRPLGLLARRAFSFCQLPAWSQ